jgi:hypothetical protein
MKNRPYNNTGYYTQLPDGRWVPAQPIPYYRDTRPIRVKIWHVIKLLYLMVRLRNIEKAGDIIEAEADIWLVPVEPYTDKNGKWHTY